ncbi:hypothetical protein [Streptomyces sp. NPDC006638]|uniref:hypothetical protein n=1 Tax=Streptomyces sp. NPDC006638 TaxID=3157183 RepID=UPI0033B00EFA
MSDLTEPLHGRAADEIRDQLRADGLTAPVRDLLAAILDALTVPFPANSEPHDAHYRLLDKRASYVCASLRGLLADEHPEPAFDAGFIRKRTASLPAAYKPWVAPEDRTDGGSR